MKTLFWRLKGIQVFGWRYAWHLVFGCPDDQIAGPWCECMGVRNITCEDEDDCEV